MALPVYTPGSWYSRPSTSPPPGLVAFRSLERRLVLGAQLGDGDITPSGGVGGFDPVARPGKRPITPWRGPSEPYTLTVPLMFDRYAEGEQGESVEGPCRTLDVMAGVNVPRDPEPPQLEVFGALPNSTSVASQNRYVINGLEWGPAIRRRSDGQRVRQAVTVTLLLYTEDDKLDTLKKSPKPAYSFVRAHDGDTFEKIAARELKLKRAGNRLARLNGKRDGSAKVKGGTQVRLPTAHTLALWRKALK